MHLIVGLGNPGAKYRNTRHNVGFRVVEALAERLDCAFNDRAGDALLAEAWIGDESVTLAKPLTYMNRSGRAVEALLRRTGASHDTLLVVYDDVHLEAGRIRLRPKGSAGGHNGVQDVIDRLGSREFARLRVGVGDDFAHGELVDYVLSPFSRAQRPLVEEAVTRSQEAIVTFVQEGLQPAMSRFNG